MVESQGSTGTARDEKAPSIFTLDLSGLPPVYVLAAHLSIDEQHKAENALSERGAPLTYDIKEAKLVLGNISRTQRAKLELRWKGLRIEEVKPEKVKVTHPRSSSHNSIPAAKKRKVAHAGDANTGHSVIVIHDDSSTAPETADEDKPDTKPILQPSISGSPSSPLSSPSTVREGEVSSSTAMLPDFSPDSVIVVKLEWLTAVVSADKLIPMQPFIILYSNLLPAEQSEHPEHSPVMPEASSNVKQINSSVANRHSDYKDQGSIMDRAKADPKPKPVFSRFRRRDRIAEAANKDIAGKSFSGSHVSRRIQLLHQTSSEDNEIRDSAIPRMPDWVLENKIYSCERSTPLDSPNADFITLLKKIRLARELTLDQIGVRAYSTSIASIAAYPYRLRNSREVLALPGCDAKIGHLFHEYRTTGQLRAVVDLEADPALKVLREFFEIWGVGAVTAREFYYDKGWRDLDDIIEHGWNSLSRVQQIGLKYYDEFQENLTRAQVEDIAATITRHAALVTDTNSQTAIVGGYRRGKAESRDVDIILSHPNEAQTANLVTKVVKSLEQEGWITYTLTLNLTTTKRGQDTLPINTGTLPGRGFDTLDKALVVWQSPDWPTHTADLAADPTAKNPNPHRRVDIIVSPWRTVGCAVAGWTSGTTFQRDLRRYCKYRKGWKFDSSGVRERGSGAWVDLEAWREERTLCKDWQEAEKRVFAGLGLVWREPWERCTG